MVSWPTPPSRVSLPAPPIRMSLPAKPSSVLLPELPVRVLAVVLPWPLMLLLPFSVRLSMPEANVVVVAVPYLIGYDYEHELQGPRWTPDARLTLGLRND